MNANSNPKSLSGLRVLVGRARHQASVLSSSLRELGADVMEIPFIEIRKPQSYTALDEALKKLDTYDWMILTSVNGVEAVWNRLETLNLNQSQPVKLRIAAIGPATKKAIERRGFKVDVVPKRYVAEAVVESLRNRVKAKRILLARAKVARDVIPEELTQAGAIVDVVEAYETVIPDSGRTKLKVLLEDESRRPHIITFTSSSTVKNFLALISGAPRDAKEGKPDLDGILLASIGPITSATLRDSGFNVDIEAKEYTIPGLVAAIRSTDRVGP